MNRFLGKGINSAFNSYALIPQIFSPHIFIPLVFSSRAIDFDEIFIFRDANKIDMIKNMIIPDVFDAPIKQKKHCIFASLLPAKIDIEDPISHTSITCFVGSKETT